MKILMIILFICLFFIWTYFMIFDRLERIDKKIYQSLKFTDSKTLFFRIITQVASVKYFVIICVLLLLLLNNKRLAIIITMMMIVDSVIVWGVKHIIRRERPNIKRLVYEKGYSYPSGHTFSATCFYGLFIFLVWLNPLSMWLQIILSVLLILLILIIGFSRIYLGVHYFSDVVGGFLISTAYLFLYVYIVYDFLNFL